MRTQNLTRFRRHNSRSPDLYFSLAQGLGGAASPARAANLSLSHEPNGANAVGTRRFDSSNARRRAGFTLIEVLVVIAIVGVLVALLLPAVQAARESGRLAACQNNARQIGMALHQHEAAYRRFPSGGWGFLWVGDPDRGTDIRQPGGWIYSVLPYVERTELAGLGKGMAPADKRAALARLSQQGVPLFNCPTRRGSELSPFDQRFPAINADLVADVAKTDYAINGGDLLVRSGFGPPDLATADNRSYAWPDFSKATGICHVRSQIRLAHVRDGQSNTYMVGEKYMSTLPGDPGDDQSMYVGYDQDQTRWTELQYPLTRDSAAAMPERFGSAHPGGVVFVMCDGSVRIVNFSIDGEIHRRLGNRNDGLPVE